MTELNTLSKTSASVKNAQSHLFWLFAQYQQTAISEGYEAANHLFFFADYCFSRVNSTQKKQLAENLLLFFVQQSAQLLTAVFKGKKSNKLEFIFFLTEDISVNRVHIFNFLDFYENLEIAESIPIHFRILPPQVLAEFTRSQAALQLF